MFDPEFIRMVLYQAWPCDRSPKDFYAEAWCLRNVELADYLKLQRMLTDNKLIEESGERGYYKITQRGEYYRDGEEYELVMK